MVEPSSLTVVIVASDDPKNVSAHLLNCKKYLEDLIDRKYIAKGEIVLVTSKICSSEYSWNDSNVELKHLCELTRGIYPAMNTAISNARNDFVLFSNVCDTPKSCFLLNKKVDIYCGSVANYNGLLKAIRTYS